MWEVEVQTHTFLTSALEGTEWSASRLDCLIPADKVPIAN